MSLQHIAPHARTHASGPQQAMYHALLYGYGWANEGVAQVQERWGISVSS
jgi:hypothetical protein